MHRTQVLLEEEQYERLKQESARTGRSIGDLVRAAIEETYGRRRKEEALRALDESFGVWADRDDIPDGAEYVEQVRRGWSRRWAERGWDG